MKIVLLPHRIYTLLAVVLFLNLFFLGGTWLFHHHLYEILGGDWGESSALSLLLVEFSLANENVLATWYSSMLLLTVGLMSLLCFLVRKKAVTTTKEKYLNVGWLLFFLLFVGLSLDEMASLHERLGNMTALNPFGDYPLGWIFLLGIPIAAVSCLMAWFCLVQIKRAPLAVALAVIGILLFMSVPLQEYVEVEAWNAAPDMATWQRPVHFLLIEEGTELFAATFMLMSTFTFLLYALNHKKEKKLSLKPPPVLELNLHRSRSILLTGLSFGLLSLVLLLLITSPSLALEGDPGILYNWFPSAVAFLTFLFALYLLQKDPGQGQSLLHPYLLVACFSLFISLYYGGNLYGYFKNPTGSLWKIFVVSILCLVTVSLGFMLFKRSKKLFNKMGIILWSLFVLTALPMSNRPAAIMIFLAFSILFLVLLDQYFQRLAVSRSSTIEGLKNQKIPGTSTPSAPTVLDRKKTSKTGRPDFTSRTVKGKKS